MSADPDRLYLLLPVVMRERDQDNGYPLRALLRIVAEQAGELQGDMWQLYADHFVETCQPWVIPYIGDLVGNELVYDDMRRPPDDTATRLFPDLAGPDLRPAIQVQSRTDVANTIRYRRRKGTHSVLEALARDVTGWMARVVETRDLLGVTQHLEHARTGVTWAALRDPAAGARGPFDALHRTAALRANPGAAAPLLGGVCVFLWRLQAQPLTNVPTRAVGAAWRRHVSPLAARAPLFRLPGTGAADLGPVTAADVPAPVTRDELRRDLAALYGPVVSLNVNGTSVAAELVRSATLEPWPDQRPAGSAVLVDPVAGRLAIGEDWGRVAGVSAGWVTAFPGPLGGGPYSRRAWLIAAMPRDGAAAPLRLTVLDGQPEAPAAGSAQTHFGSVAAALDAWARAGRPDAVISVLDSRTYALPERLRLPRLGRLAIEAAEGQRPLLVTGADGLAIEVDAAPALVETEAALTLGGVALEGHLALAGPLRRLRLLHATLVPGRGFDADGRPRAGGPSLTIRPRAAGRRSRRLRVEVAFSITGALHVPEDAEGLWLLDSIVDGHGGVALAGAELGDGDAAPAWLERTTVLGESFVREVTATDCIFTGRVASDRTQRGCVRFSHVPRGSRTPPRFACQPDTAIAAEARDRQPGDEAARIAAAAVAPVFTSVRYGDPAYCQLAATCPTEIRTGAGDGSEMGAFNFLKQPQRASNLELRLAEYLPIGLEAQVITVT